MPTINMDYKIINWNIGGAKFLDLKSDPTWQPKKDFKDGSPQQPACREEYKWRLEEALDLLLETNKPHVVTLQEVVQYEEYGNFNNAKNIISSSFLLKKGYKFLFTKLIDTIEFSAQRKWHKIRKKNQWKPEAYFAQGNAILVRDDVKLFPVLGIPSVQTTFDKYRKKKHIALVNKEVVSFGGPIKIGKIDDNLDLKCSTETIFVKQGLYFGTRDTEPRAAIITHIVVDEQTVDKKKFKKPLDIFIINLHLTTLTSEREGIPDADMKGSAERLVQLKQIFADISGYNEWKKNNFQLGKDAYPTTKKLDSKARFAPVWIISGDFNFAPGSYEYDYIIKRDFIDLIPNKNLGTKSDRLAKHPTHTVDYIFAGPQHCSIDSNHATRIDTTENRVISENFVKVSDHMPLIAKVPIQIDN